MIHCRAPAAWVGAFCLSIVLGGCASPVLRWQPVTSLLEQRQRHVVIQQWDLSCGAAAMATLMNFQHGEFFRERQVAESMLRRTNPLTVRIKGGFSLLDLKRFAAATGYRGSGYLSLQFHQLTALQPAIVPVNLGDFNHFVVFRGIVDDQVLVADPAFGNRTISRQDFDKGWLGRIAFVVRRRDELEPPNVLGVEPVDLLRVPSRMIRQALR